jgi:hypothetical protein
LVASPDAGADVIRSRLVEALAGEPAYTLPERLVEECTQLAGGPVALYAVDIEGACLLHVAGTDRLPSVVPVRGVGPELGSDGVQRLRDHLAQTHPEASVEPLWVRGRATTVLVSAGRCERPLTDLAELAGPILELLGGYTDQLERARRRKPVSASAELQQGLLPPRLTPVRGGRVAASILPAYDVGGDWFDYADNADGLWIAVADAVGKGPRAAAISALAVGALRAARRRGDAIEEACQAIHAALQELWSDAWTTAIVGTWEQDSATLRWVNCGHPPPLLVRGGEVEELVGERTQPLGMFEAQRRFDCNTATLRSGDRLLLYSDGIVERRTADGRFGVDRLAAALQAGASLPPSAAIAAIEEEVLAASEEDIGDDATQLLLLVE